MVPDSQDLVSSEEHSLFQMTCKTIHIIRMHWISVIATYLLNKVGGHKLVIPFFAP